MPVRPCDYAERAPLAGNLENGLALIAGGMELIRDGVTVLGGTVPHVRRQETEAKRTARARRADALTVLVLLSLIAAQKEAAPPREEQAA